MKNGGYYGAAEDQLNSRFSQQLVKRNYGIDPQYPISRYTDGLSKTKVPDRTHRAHHQDERRRQEPRHRRLPRHRQVHEPALRGQAPARGRRLLQPHARHPHAGPRLLRRRRRRAEQPPPLRSDRSGEEPHHQRRLEQDPRPGSRPLQLHGPRLAHDRVEGRARRSARAERHARRPRHRPGPRPRVGHGRQRLAVCMHVRPPDRPHLHRAGHVVRLRRHGHQPAAVRRDPRPAGPRQGVPDRPRVHGRPRARRSGRHRLALSDQPQGRQAGPDVRVQPGRQSHRRPSQERAHDAVSAAEADA